AEDGIRDFHVTGVQTCALPISRLGVLYSATGIRRLLELVGPAVAQELLFTADPVDGPRALALGLVNRLAPRAELATAAAALLARSEERRVGNRMASGGARSRKT